MSRSARRLPLPGEEQEVSVAIRMFQYISKGLDEKEFRGIPAGYVNALETRLAETERALFFTLRELHDGVVAQGDDYGNHVSYQTMSEPALSNRTPSTQQEKADLVASWASRPLENRIQARAWLESMRKTGNSATSGVHQEKARVQALHGTNFAPATTPQVSSLIETQSVSNTTEIIRPERSQPSSFRTSREKGERARRSATRTSQRYRSHEDKGAADTAMTAARPSRASLFANANKNIYF